MDCHGLKILGFTHLCNLSMVDCLSLSSIHSNVPSLTFSFTCAGHNAASYLSFDPSDNTRRVTVLLVLPSCAVNVQGTVKSLELFRLKIKTVNKKPKTVVLIWFDIAKKPWFYC